MLLRDLVFDCNVKMLSGAELSLVVSEPFSDSRRPIFGGLFICLRGGNTDGHCYALEAVERGAAAVVSEYPIEGVPSVVVDDTRRAAARIWNNYFGRPSDKMRFFGITGTNGKTSTSYFLNSCFNEAGVKSAVVGTLGSFFGGVHMENDGSEKYGTPCAMTTPDPKYLYGALSEFAALGAKTCVMEVSSHAILYKKTDALSFEGGVFTNLTPEHLDFHKTMEEYFRIKASFIEKCAFKIVNRDDTYGNRLARLPDTVAASGKMLSDISFEKGVSYSFLYDGKRVNIESPLSGDFNLYNSFLATLCALQAGVSIEDTERGIREVKAIRGRMEKCVSEEEFGFDVYIDYAHTPAALESVLSCLKGKCRGRLICVFGCGGERDREKRPLMGRIAQRWADRVIVTSDNSRGEDALGIIRNIIIGMEGNNSIVIPDRAEAVYCAVTTAREGDIVLLAGKGHEKYEIGPLGKRPFDERKIVKEALKAKCGK